MLKDFNIDIKLPKGYSHGYTVIENYLIDIDELSSEKKMIILMLRRFVGTENISGGTVVPKEDPARPSLSNLAKKCGISINTASKCLYFYEWMGWITKENTYGSNGIKGVNHYTLHLDKIPFYLVELKERKISFALIEEYFNSLYQNKKNGGHDWLNKGFVFLSKTYNTELIEEIMKPFKKPPKKKREI